MEPRLQDNKLVVQYSPIHVKAYSVNELRMQVEECDSALTNLLAAKEFWQSKLDLAVRLGIKE